MLLLFAARCGLFFGELKFESTASRLCRFLTKLIFLRIILRRIRKITLRVCAIRIFFIIIVFLEFAFIFEARKLGKSFVFGVFADLIYQRRLSER